MAEDSEAEKMVAKGLQQLGLATEAGGLIPCRKGDPRKVALACVVKVQAYLTLKAERGIFTVRGSAGGGGLHK